MAKANLTTPTEKKRTARSFFLSTIEWAELTICAEDFACASLARRQAMLERAVVRVMSIPRYSEPLNQAALGRLVIRAVFPTVIRHDDPAYVEKGKRDKRSAYFWDAEYRTLLEEAQRFASLTPRKRVKYLLRVSKALPSLASFEGQMVTAHAVRWGAKIFAPQCITDNDPTIHPDRSKAGKLGGKAMSQKYGPEYMKAMASSGGRARWARRYS